MKKIKSLGARVASTFAALSMLLVVTHSQVALAGPDTVKDALSKAGINGSGDFSGAYDDFDNALGIVFTIGGFWIVGCIAVGALLLSSSGSNPQRRGAGIGSLACSLIGAWILFKAYDIAGWATGIGG